MKLKSLSKFSNTYSLLALPELASESDASSSKKSGIPGTTGPRVVLLEVARTMPPDLYFFLKCAATDGAACCNLASRPRSRPSAVYIGGDVNVTHRGIIHRRRHQSLAVAVAVTVLSTAMSIHLLHAPLVTSVRPLHPHVQEPLNVLKVSLRRCPLLSPQMSMRTGADVKNLQFSAYAYLN